MVKSGGMDDLLSSDVRPAAPSAAQQLRLSSADVDAMAGEYMAGGQSIYDLAAKYGVHRVTVSRHLRSRGLALGKQPLSGAEVRRAKELRTQRLTYQVIARQLSRGATTVRSALKRED